VASASPQAAVAGVPHTTMAEPWIQSEITKSNALLKTAFPPGRMFKMPVTSQRCAIACYKLKRSKRADFIKCAPWTPGGLWRRWPSVPTGSHVTRSRLREQQAMVRHVDAEDKDFVYVLVKDRADLQPNCAFHKEMSAMLSTSTAEEFEGQLTIKNDCKAVLTAVNPTGGTQTRLAVEGRPPSWAIGHAGSSRDSSTPNKIQDSPAPLESPSCFLRSASATRGSSTRA